MAKFIISGLWTCLIFFCSLLFCIPKVSLNPLKVEKNTPLVKRTNVITVPIIKNNEIEGYIVTQLVCLVNEIDVNLLPIPLDIFINDDIFRIFFGAYSDNRDIHQVKFDEIKPLIINNINRQFQRPIIQDLLVEKFEFISRK